MINRGPGTRTEGLLNSEVGSLGGVGDMDLLVQVLSVGDIFTDHGLLHSFEFVQRIEGAIALATVYG